MNRDDILTHVLKALWDIYKSRVTYAATYEALVTARGGTVVNDHIAFRTFNTDIGSQPAGVDGIARIFLSLGYEKKDTYTFDDKHLTAWHFEHATHPENPKIFISQLEVSRLNSDVAGAIRECVKGAPDLLSGNDRDLLNHLSPTQGLKDDDALMLIKNVTQFFSRPWTPPKQSILASVNKASQYAAWTLLHGNAVNHFTAYINQQNVPEWKDLELTLNAMHQAGLPMKEEIEGERGSKLRQSSTQAIDTLCDVLDDKGAPSQINWSYAYYEFAERGMVPGPDGKPVLFQGFLGPQATNLFEMTKRE